MRMRNVASITEAEKLEKEISEYNASAGSEEKFLKLVEKYETFDELTAPMLNEFIEKILVHECDRKGSSSITQEIEVYFNFIEKYTPAPAKEEPDRDQQAEQERVLALRAKRHRAYIRRKESGWQARYEAKRKEQKGACAV